MTLQRMNLFRPPLKRTPEIIRVEFKLSTFKYLSCKCADSVALSCSSGTRAFVCTSTRCSLMCLCCIPVFCYVGRDLRFFLRCCVIILGVPSIL